MVMGLPSQNNVIYLMLPNGNKHSSFSLANSHDGSTQLVKRIFTAMTSNNIDSVLIGLEATSVYGDNLVYFLKEIQLSHPSIEKSMS